MEAEAGLRKHNISSNTGGRTETCNFPKFSRNDIWSRLECRKRPPRAAAGRRLQVNLFKAPDRNPVRQ